MKTTILGGWVSLMLVALTPQVFAAELSVAKAIDAEQQHALQFLQLPELTGVWEIEYHWNDNQWIFKNNELQPKRGSYATATLYLQDLGHTLPTDAKLFAQAITQSGALASGMRFSQVSKIEKIANGFIIYGQEQSELDPSGQTHPSFVAVRHLAGVNVVCRQGDASDLANPQELVQAGVNLCLKLTR